MSLAAPWALLGLLALPVIWWIQRHRRKAEVVELPTLMFLLEEDERVHQPRKRRLDLETILALAAAALLAVAAAGPVFEHGAPVQRVRVVVAGGAPAEAAGYADRVEAALDAMRVEDVELEVVWVPARSEASRYAPRPPVDTLLTAVRAGAASVRIVVSDRVPEGAPQDVRWVGVGDADAMNLGIVGARVIRTGEGSALFVTVQRDPALGDTLGATLRLDTHSAPLRIDTEGYGAVTFPLPAGAPDRAWRLRLVDADDALDVDDEVTIRVRPFGVTLDPALDGRVRAALERALDAALGPAARVEDAATRIGAGRAPDADLGVGSIPEGGAARTAPRGTPLRQRDALVADLDPVGIVWVYAEGDEEIDEDERVLLGVRAGDRTWPIVTRRADGCVRFAPDPTRGDPAPADAPLWPLFIENWIRARGTFGVEPVGLLDADTSRLGRDVVPFERAWIAGAAPTVPAPRLPLRVPLLALALVALAVLWAVPVATRRAAAAAA